MKLVFHGLNDLEMHLASNPSIRHDRLDVRAASFTMDGNLVLEEGQVLTGEIEMMSDDDMHMNRFVVEEFLRYELNNYETKCNLLLTQDPVPPPPPEPIPPTEEELLAGAKAGRYESIAAARDDIIYQGMDVETTYGLEHFRLSERDQTMLMGIYTMTLQGVTAYPYHSLSPDAHSNNICTVYSDEDFGKIATAAFAHITYHESYANLLQQWLERETDYNVVYGIEYGASLPTDLYDYFCMIMASAGIEMPAEQPASMLGEEEAPIEETPVEEQPAE